MADNFDIRSSSLPSQARVAAFRGSEGISRPYVFDIYVAVDGLGLDVDIDVDDAPGSAVTLSIKRSGGEPPVEIHGVIATMELLRSVSVKGGAMGLGAVNSLYRLQLVPHLWQLTLTRHSRIWTGKSVPEIIEDVLDSEGISQYELRLDRSYDVEEHVTQYKESSLDFIERWMARLGLYYFFEQTDSGETLVITDHRATSSLSIAAPVPYHPAGADDAVSGAHFDTFTWRHATLPAAVRLTDYDYAKPALEMVGNASVGRYGVGEQVLYGGRFFTKQQGEALAAVRAEDLRARAKTFHASGRVHGVSAGFRFALDRHPRASLNTEYLAVTVEHFGSVAESMKTWGKLIAFQDHVDETYFVELSAIDASQQYRHAETVPWPRLDGFENAVVDGPATSEYAQLDDQGRYKVKFKFDEGTDKDGKASTWVRKSQPHAGTVEGWHFPERAGTEVICAFLGGDPDRPIIIGAVPTATTQSPVTSSNATLNVIQTGGRNRIELDDANGSQRMTMSTPHKSTFITLGKPVSGLGQVYNGDQDIPNHEVAISTDGNSLLRTAGENDMDVGEHWNVWVGGNHIERIGTNVVHQVGGYMKQSIHGLLLQNVTGTVEEAYQSTYTQGVEGAVKLNHNTTFDHHVTGAVTETFDTGLTSTITGPHKHTVKGNQEIHVTGNQTVTIDAAVIEKWQASKDSYVNGVATNMYYGFKKEVMASGTLSLCAAAKAGITVGVNAEVNMALKLTATASASFELMPSKFQVAGQTGKAAAAKRRAAAIHQTTQALQQTMTALRSFTGAVAQGNAGLEQKQHALKQRISALNNSVAGLHNTI